MKAGTLLNLARLCLCACVLASAALVIDYQHPGEPAFCAAQSACDTVRQSPLSVQISKFFEKSGMQLPDLARIAFLVLLAASFFVKRWWHLAGVTAATCAGAAFGLYLVYVQLTLQAFCAYCMVVDISIVLAAALLVAATVITRNTPTSERDAAVDPQFSSVVHASEAMSTLAWGAAGALVTALPLVWSYFPVHAPPPAAIAALQEPGKITIVSFTDFECPHCRTLHEKAMRELEQKDDVVIKRFMVPLPFHKGAMPAALVYTCTPEAQREKIVDALYAAKPKELEYNNIVDYAVLHGIEDGPGLRRCMSLDETKLKIDQDRLFFYGDLASDALPTTWVGNTVVKGSFADKVKAAYAHTSGSGFYLPVWLMFVVAGVVGVGAFVIAEKIGRRKKAAAHPHQPSPFPQYPSPQPGNGVPSDEKTFGTVAHLGALLMPVVLPILMFFIGTNKPFQRAVALQAVIVQISTMVLSIVGAMASFALVLGAMRSGGGTSWMLAYLIPLLVMLLGLGMSIMGMVKAGQGEVWYAPVIGRWLARVCRLALNDPDSEVDADRGTPSAATPAANKKKKKKKI